MSGTVVFRFALIVLHDVLQDQPGHGSTFKHFAGNAPMRIRDMLVVAALFVTVDAEGLGAQTPATGPARVPAACTYSTCALRVESRLFGSSLVRGAAGESVGPRLSVFGGGADLLLAGPDSSAAHARAYVRDSRRAATLGLLGTVAAVVLIVRHEGRTTDDIDATSTGLAIASVGLSLAAIPFMVRAQRDLSRAVWWYNAALPR